MGFVFDGYDENNVPRYSYIPDGNRKIEKPEEPAGTIKFNPTDAPSEFCTARGGTISGTNCILPDGTVCEMQSFYNGACPVQTQPILFLAVGLIIGAILGSSLGSY
jgi:putative hemolysin